MIELECDDRHRNDTDRARLGPGVSEEYLVRNSLGQARQFAGIRAAALTRRSRRHESDDRRRAARLRVNAHLSRLRRNARRFNREPNRRAERNVRHPCRRTFRERLDLVDGNPGDRRPRGIMSRAQQKTIEERRQVIGENCRGTHHDPRGNCEGDCFAANTLVRQALERQAVAEPGDRIDDCRLKLRRSPPAGPGRFELQSGNQITVDALAAFHRQSEINDGFAGRQLRPDETSRGRQSQHHEHCQNHLPLQIAETKRPVAQKIDRQRHEQRQPERRAAVSDAQQPPSPARSRQAISQISELISH